MRSPWIGPSVLALALLAFVPPSFAQYMYLDSNGDGAHTAADVLHAVGPTVVDIWLDTNHNRDGSVVTCDDGSTYPLDMFSYVVDLSATGGTVTYSAYTNRISEMGPLYPPRPPDGTNFSTGPFVTAVTAQLPPGRYLLGTLTVNAVSGTPSIQIVPGSDFSIFFDITAFGSHCGGTDFPNTIALGTDWFDADGLPFGSGGMVNQPPTFSPPAGMTVLSGENATQEITATDPEGQSLAFAKGSGPAFLFVAPTDQGVGTGHAEIRLAPFAADVGTSIGSVTVSDGAASTQASFGVTVTQGPNHAPYLPALPPVTVVAGRIERRFLSAGDPDGNTVHFRKAAGPAFVGLRELATGPGGATAALTASPTVCDVGQATAAIAFTDGVTEEQRQVPFTVLPSSASPDTSAIHSAGPQFAFAVALGDLNEDGRLDAVVTLEGPRSISVLLGLGDGHLGPPVSFPLPSRAGPVAVADFNSDGHLDVAVGNTEEPGVSVLLGVGNGTLLPPTVYGIGVEAFGIVAADMNHDGIIDLVTSNRRSGTVSVLLGRGDGTFARRSDTSVGGEALSLAVGDFNQDGRLDVAVCTTSPSTITILPGLGDGSFGNAVQTPVPGYPFSVSAADWNWDGAVDLAVLDLGQGKVRTLSGHGNGTFNSPSTLLSLDFPYTSAAADLNADGNMDLVVGDPERGVLAIFLGDGAGGFAPPVYRIAGPQALAIGDMNGDGRPDIVVTDGAVSVYLNAYSSPAAVDARAFVENESRTLPTSGTGANVCVRVEPVNGSYSNADVDVSSIVLRSNGTGSVSEIHSVASKKAVVSDTDRNGVPEIGACFAQPDLGALFDLMKGRSMVTAQVAGSLTSGRMFCTSVDLTIKGGTPPSKVAFAPNPLNPRSTLTITTLRDGPAKAVIFDTQGRLVRTLLATPRLTAGKHEFVFDGTSDRGAQLSSGVYFYRVESTEGSAGGRIVILK